MNFSKLGQIGTELIKVVSGGAPTGPARNTASRKPDAFDVMRQRDDMVKKKLYREIDDLLTRECFFCGQMLIDMIDNDVEVKVPGENDMFAFDIDEMEGQIPDARPDAYANADDDWGI